MFQLQTADEATFCKELRAIITCIQHHHTAEEESFCKELRAIIYNLHATSNCTGKLPRIFL